MQVLYLILSLESDDTSIASFSAFPAFIVLTLKSCWLLPVWQKKHRSLFNGCVADQVNGAAEPLTSSASPKFFNLRPLTFGVCGLVDMECACRSLARSVWILLVTME